MTLRLEAMIEHWTNEHLLFVRALPGFCATGATPSELHGRSGDALQAHLDWLVERELIDAPSGEVDLVVVEEADASTSKTGPRFAADLLAPDAAEIEAALAVGRAALSDLIDAADDPDSEVVRVLRHIADLDRWYASCLHGQPAGQITLGDPIDDMVAAAGDFEDTVDAFAAGISPELFDRDGEEWTLAKVLRRRTAHLREHLIDIIPK